MSSKPAPDIQGANVPVPLQIEIPGPPERPLLPLSGFVQMSTPVSHEQEAKLVWSARADKFPRERMRSADAKLAWKNDTFTALPRARWWAGALQGIYALRPEKTYERWNEKARKFRTKVQDALWEARFMPDATPGLLVFSDHRFRETARRAPPAILRMLVEEAAQDMGGAKPRFEPGEYLTAVTEGVRNPLFLHLDARGNLMVVASLYDANKVELNGINEHQSDHGAWYLAASIEIERHTNMRLEDFAHLTEPFAAGRLVQRFWAEVVKPMRDPIIGRPHGFTLKEKFQASEVTWKRGSEALAREALTKIISITYARGILETWKKPNTMPQTAGHLGFHCGTPHRKAFMTDNLCFSIIHGIRCLTTAILDRMEPKGAGLNPLWPMGWNGGNRLSNLDFTGYEIREKVGPIMKESAHFHLEAEVRLLEIMIEIGISPERAQEFIDGVVPQ
jgi:hypothetical protein